MLELKKHIALFSLLVLLIPSVIQVAHAIENHEHTVCMSVDDHHFHEKDVDCSQLHYQLEVFSHNFTSNYAVIPTTYYNTRYDLQPQIISKLTVVKKSLRGPPFIYNF